MNGVFQFNITKGRAADATWTVDAKGGNCVKPSAPPKADCTIRSATPISSRCRRQAQRHAGVHERKMKIKGNMALAQKFGALVDQKKSKL